MSASGQGVCGRHPPGKHPLGRHTPCAVHTRMWSTSRNAFLLTTISSNAIEDFDVPFLHSHLGMSAFQFPEA